MQMMIDQGSSQFSRTVRILNYTYGLLGVRVGEASHFGPDHLPDGQLTDAVEFDLTRDSERSNLE